MRSSHSCFLRCGLPDMNRVSGRLVRFHHLLVSHPRAGGKAAAVAGLVSIRPTDVLLELDRQGTDRPFGEVTGASLTIFMSEAADAR